MTKSIEEQALDAAQFCKCRGSVCHGCEPIIKNSFINGAKSRDAEWIKVVNELREALNKSTEVLHEAYYEIDDDADEYKEQCIKNREVIIKADQMIENMGVKL